jgi:hypothetical protein
MDSRETAADVAAQSTVFCVHLCPSDEFHPQPERMLDEKERLV